MDAVGMYQPVDADPPPPGYVAPFQIGCASSRWEYRRIKGFSTPVGSPPSPAAGGASGVTVHDPDVAVDDAGNVHLAWIQSEPVLLDAGPPAQHGFRTDVYYGA